MIPPKLDERPGVRRRTGPRANGRIPLPLLLGFVLFFFVSPLTAVDPAHLIGLWGGDESFGPAMTGMLVVDGRGNDWRAEVGGVSVKIERDGAALRFSTPDDQGAFRGTLGSDRRRIVGQWIQPAGVTLSSRYATPVVLSRVDDGRWRGNLKPLEDRLTLYLLVQAEPDGKLTASIRNPELNFGREGPYAVRVENNRIALTSSHPGAAALTAAYDPIRDRLTLDLPGGLRMELLKRDPETASGFYPQRPTGAAFIYHPPGPAEDGWPTGSLEEVGLDAERIGDLVRHILQTRYSGFHTPYIHSLLIARHGKLVLERYFYGYERDTLHDMRSASKTFAGALLGLAREGGPGLSLESPLRSLLPEYEDLFGSDPRKARITVQDLLTMTSGLACDDNDDSSPGREDAMQSGQDQPDWCRFTLSLPMTKKPGGKDAVYCSGAVNLLGAVIRHMTAQPIPEFFQAHWAKPLEYGPYAMNLMPNGKAYLGGGMHMRPRDQLKLGQVYLDGGLWKGRRILDAEWVHRSLEEYSSFEPNHRYGLAWHIMDLESGGGKFRVYEAGGNGGQFVLLIPELDLVVGFTGGNYGDYRTWSRFLTELVPKYILPAAGSHTAAHIRRGPADRDGIPAC